MIWLLLIGIIFLLFGLSEYIVIKIEEEDNEC